MTKTHGVWAVGIVVLCLMARDNWQLREAVANMKAENAHAIATAAKQATLTTQTLAVLPAGSTAAISREIKPVPQPSLGTGGIDEQNAVVPTMNQKNVEIPLGTDLAAAIKKLQHEQSKPQANSAGISPFGSPN